MRQHSLRLDNELMQAVDSKRGLIPRNTWIVAAIKVALGENLYDGLTDTGPGPKKPGVPEAERRARAAAERQLGKSPEESIAAVRRVQSAKPPLQRPIIQKRT